MKTKNAGITIIIAMGTSLIVLGLAFATLNSVAQSLEQANNIQRSTQLFFASESGLEAAFFHHNARGQGATLSTTASQTLEHDEINADTEWNVVGRASDTSGSTTFYADVLREHQTVQIPLSWDTSTDPTSTPNESGALSGTEEMTISFYKQLQDPTGTTNDTPTNSDIRSVLLAEYDEFVIENTTGAFDFGNTDQEVLIDWSISRKNSGRGVQTFIPTANDSCDPADGPNVSIIIDGFICEQQLNNLNTQSLDISTTAGSGVIDGKILPGLADTNLADFWDCNDVSGGETCSEFRVTFRPLLGFTDTDGSKIIGIPFSITSSLGTQFPLPNYSVMTDVTQEDFSQAINLEIEERTSIGAFDYVIFD